MFLQFILEIIFLNTNFLNKLLFNFKGQVQ